MADSMRKSGVNILKCGCSTYGAGYTGQFRPDSGLSGPDFEVNDDDDVWSIRC